MLACLDMTGGLESALRGTDSTLREIAQRHWRSIQAHRPCVLRAPSRATDLHVGYRTAYSDGHLESDLVSVWHFIITHGHRSPCPSLALRTVIERGECIFSFTWGVLGDSLAPPGPLVMFLAFSSAFSGCWASSRAQPR